MNPIKETNYQFPNQSRSYRGKVRDVYQVNDKIVMVHTDRISAFDVVLPKAIPFKGQVLAQTAYKFLQETAGLVPNYLEANPHPNVLIGKMCEPQPIEMVIRGYLAGHAWREYRAGKRELCGVPLPDGLKENDKLPVPIITPTTKAHEGHDEDISKDEILERELVSEEEYEQMERYTYALYQYGTEYAAKQGLILVDTKYEFGRYEGRILLIDEVHTPDSSRYFYKDTYQEIQDKGEPQKQLSKEFVRQWLISKGFQGQKGAQVPVMEPEFIEEVSSRYIELFEKVTGDSFNKHKQENLAEGIEQSVVDYLEKVNV
jgi:phosphoribosylaminoimidazole-succinocarboxamide synthase